MEPLDGDGGAHFDEVLRTARGPARYRRIDSTCGESGAYSPQVLRRIRKCSIDTALRDIQDLLERGLFIRNPGGGRSTSYRLPRADELAEPDAK